MWNWVLLSKRHGYKNRYILAVNWISCNSYQADHWHMDRCQSYCIGPSFVIRSIRCTLWVHRVNHLELEDIWCCKQRSCWGFDLWLSNWQELATVPSNYDIAGCCYLYSNCRAGCVACWDWPRPLSIPKTPQLPLTPPLIIEWVNCCKEYDILSPSVSTPSTMVCRLPFKGELIAKIRTGNETIHGLWAVLCYKWWLILCNC